MRSLGRYIIYVLVLFTVYVLMVLAAVTIAQAQIVVTEDFSYPTGSLGGQWTALCSGHTASVKSPGLAYPGYIGSGIGNAGFFDSSGSEYKLTNSFNITSFAYMSFLINADGIQTGGGGTCSQGNDFLAAFHASGGGVQNFNNHTGLILDPINGSQYTFGIEGPTSGQMLANGVYNVKTTYLVVLALDQNNYYLYINPPLDGSLATPDITYPTGVNYSAIDNIVFGQNNYGHILIDGIRITSNLADLTINALAPEPAYPPTSLTFANVTSSSLAVSYGAGQDNPNSSLVVRNNTTNVSFIPTDGTGYTAGQDVGNGDTISLASGCCTIAETGLLPQTNYFYRVFSANQTGDNSTINYLTSSYLEGSQYTLSVEPSAHPSVFVASAGSSSQINLSFSAATTLVDADGYVILRREDGTDPSAVGFVNGLAPADLTFPQGTTLLAFINATGVISFADSGLPTNTQYNYAIIPFNWDGVNSETLTFHTSGSIKTSSTFTLTLAPNALPATAPTQFSFTANWSSVIGATSYALDVSSDNFSTFTTGFNNLAVFNTTQTVTGLTAGTTYQYRVRALNAGGPSANSNNVSIITVPATPMASNATSITANNFLAGWSTVSGVTNYNLQISTDGFLSYTAYDTLETTKFFKGLTAGTFYQYQVRAENSSGSSPFSNIVSLITVPSAPTGAVTSDVTQSGFTLSWDRVKGAADGYQLDVSTDNFSTFVSGYGNLTVTDTTLNIAGLNAGTTYQSRIRAVNASGTSTNASAISVITIPATPLPLNASAIDQNSFTASWNLITGASDYRLDVSADGFVTFVPGYENFSVSSNLQLITGLAAGVLYKYRLRAVNISGSSPNSLAITVLMLPATPAALVPATITTTAFAANWNPATADHYLLEVSSDNFSTLLPGYNPKNVSPLVNADTIKALSPGKLYEYRVKSINASGASPYSNVITVPTIPLNPTGLVVSQTLSSSFIVNWSAVAGIVDHYEVDVSKDNFVSFAPGYKAARASAANSFLPVTNLLPATLYQFRVRAVNSSGASDNATSAAYTSTSSGDAFTLQLTAPAYASLITTTSMGNISTTVSNVGQASVDVVFYHKKIADNNFQKDTLSLAGGKYQAPITAAMLDELGMEYYFYAADNFGRKDSTAHNKIYRSFDGPSSPAFVNGTFTGSFKDYQIVSIPYDLNDNLIQTLFENTLGAYDIAKWRFGHYQNGTVLEYGNGINRIDRGLGYWFNAKETGKLMIKTGAGTAPKNDNDNPFSIGLVQGWNQIGNPYPFPIKWSDVLAANSSVSGVGALKNFVDGNFIDGDVIQPFSGGFVFLDNPATLSLPVSLRTPTGGRQATTSVSSDISNEAWALTLTVTQAGLVNKLGGIGMHPKANDSKDQFDDLTLPRFGNYLELVHRHSDYFYPYFSRDIVPSAPTHTWQFTVEGNGAGDATTLQWDNTSLGTGEAMLFLFDVDNFKVVDMKQHSAYSFTGEGKNRFQVFFSKAHTDLLQFDASLLGFAYPNPFAGSTQIPFVLSEEKSSYPVELAVYDVTGRKSKTLMNDRLVPGYYTISWDGTDDGGEAVSAGVYIYRLVIDGKSFARRIVAK